MGMNKKTKTTKKVNLTSSNMSEERISELRKILPEAFSENKIDWEKLRKVLGDDVDSHIEKFGFTWSGKGDAIKNVLIPSKATLNPSKDESVNFDESENLFIEGDNLEVLKLLQKAYFEKVKTIYIDPPYNTGSDFVYKDDFKAPVKNYMEQTGQKDSDGNSLSTNKETNGRYHSDWLSMMYPRLKLSWNLLRDDGVIFVSIDDNEVHRLKMLLDEIFGEENFIANIVVQTNPRGRSLDKHFAKTFEYILVYGKDASNNSCIFEIPKNEKALSEYNKEDENGKFRLLELRNRNPVFTRKNRPNLYYPIFVNPDTGGVSLEKTKEFCEEALPLNSNNDEGCWTWSKDKFTKDNTLLFGKSVSTGAWRVYRKDYIPEDGATTKEKTLWVDSSLNHENGKEELALIFETSGTNVPFDFPKSVELIKKVIEVSTSSNENHIVLDFFAGSGTTAHAVLQQNVEDGGNRKFILVQLPELIGKISEEFDGKYKSIADISKDRIKRVLNGYGDNSNAIKDGFKVLKLSESNYPENTFEFDPEKTEQENQKSFEEYLTKAKQSKLIDDTDELSIVYENIVKEGFSLNSKVLEGKVGKNSVYTVTDGEQQLLICLDKSIDKKTVSELSSKDYEGNVFICFDNALDDTAKANLGLNVELKTI